ELIELESRPGRLCLRGVSPVRQLGSNLGALCAARRRMICGEPQDPACTIRFSLRLEKRRKARNAGELKRWSTQRDRHAQRRRELGARSGPVAAPQCEMRELKLQPARE